LKFLLDTNIISEIRKRDRAHPNVVRWVARTPVAEIGTSVLVLAEIRHGIELRRASSTSGQLPSSRCNRVSRRRRLGSEQNKAAGSRQHLKARAKSDWEMK
jgi:predicted nucleic acid-binding protein